MRPADLLQFFVRDPRNGALRDALSHRGNKVELHGAVGSGIPLVTAGVLCHEDELIQPRHHVFILDDKEQAAYFMNDLQAVLENIRPVLFYPRSARVPYAEEEAVEHANIATNGWRHFAASDKRSICDHCGHSRGRKILSPVHLKKYKVV